MHTSTIFWSTKVLNRHTKGKKNYYSQFVRVPISDQSSPCCRKIDTIQQSVHYFLSKLQVPESHHHDIMLTPLSENSRKFRVQATHHPGGGICRPPCISWAAASMASTSLGSAKKMPLRISDSSPEMITSSIVFVKS